MYETSNDLAPTTRKSMIEVLNEHLADAIDLQLQAKEAHSNIKGPNFVGLHQLFDQVAAQTREYADDIAERAVGSVESHEELSKPFQSRLSSANIRLRSATGELMCGRCRMRWRHLDEAHAKPSMTQQH